MTHVHICVRVVGRLSCEQIPARGVMSAVLSRLQLFPGRLVGGERAVFALALARPPCFQARIDSRDARGVGVRSVASEKGFSRRSAPTCFHDCLGAPLLKGAAARLLRRAPVHPYDTCATWRFVCVAARQSAAATAAAATTSMVESRLRSTLFCLCVACLPRAKKSGSFSLLLAAYAAV